MRWLVRITFAVLIVVGFSLFARVIVRVKTLQLRQQLSRQRLLNYELSSEILRTRFRTAYRTDRDFAGEVRLNVLESGVMNESSDLLRVSPDLTERLGMFAVNAVRVLNFKPMLLLNQNAEALLLSQYAFLMERKKRFGEAKAIYARLEKRLSEDQADDHAFVLLHYGYCLAVQGEPRAALDKLNSVKRWYPGTHFEESARVLAVVIRENMRRKRVIAGRHGDNPRALARAFYRGGQYREAVKAFTSIRNLGAADSFRFARGLEEIGETARAEKLYRVLAGRPGAYRKPAVRRLLLLGKFFGAGKKTADYAEAQARKLGDKSALREIKKIKLVKAPRIVRELKKNPPRVAGLRADIVRGLKREFPREKFARELPEPPKQIVAAKIAPEKKPSEPIAPEPIAPITPKTEIKKETGKVIKEKSKKEERKPPLNKAKRPAPAKREPVKKKQPLKPAPKKIVKRPAPIIKQAQVLIRLNDGRVLYGNAVRMKDGLVAVRLRAGTIEIPFEAVSEITLRNVPFTEKFAGLSVQVGGRRMGAVMAIRRLRDGVIIISNGSFKRFRKAPDRIFFDAKSPGKTK